MTDGEILRRLDKIQATLQLAFRPQLEQVRKAIRSDEVNTSILDLSEDWIASSALQKAVAKETGKSTRTVRDRLSELAEQGILDVRGSEKRLEYRRTGLA
jgi:predicted transcriptional regulator YheO